MEFRPFGQGIGISASAALLPLYLWFHLEEGPEVSVELREHGGGFTENTDVGNITSKENEPGLETTFGSRPLRSVTSRGLRVFTKILGLQGIASIDARPCYFCVELMGCVNEIAAINAWTTLLPQIITIIRADLGIPDLPAYPITRDDITGANWHVELVERIFR